MKILNRIENALVAGTHICCSDVTYYTYSLQSVQPVWNDGEGLKVLKSLTKETDVHFVSYDN